MAVVTVAGSEVEQKVDAPSAVRERLEAFGVEVLADAMNRPVQVRNGGLYLRGLLEQGARKSLEPLVDRVGEEADYPEVFDGLRPDRLCLQASGFFLTGKCRH